MVRACYILGMTAALALVAAQIRDPAKTPGLEIRGEVLDSSTLEPVTNALVYAFPLLDAAGGASSTRNYSTTRSDRQGAFLFKLDSFGTYRILAEIPDHTSGPYAVYATQALTTLDKQHPRRQVRLTLPRRGTISGRVVDDQTSKPLSKFLVTVFRVVYSGGRRLAVRGGNWTAKEDGSFTVPRLEPGEYLIGTGHFLAADERRLSEDNRSAVESAFGTTYWPGGGGLDSAAPVTLRPEGTVDLGELRLKKEQLFRMRVFPAGAQCQPDDLALVHVTAVHDLWRTSNDQVARMPCGEPFLTRSLLPGFYRLAVAIDGRDRERRDWGSTFFHVTDRSADISIALTGGIDVEGRIMPAEGCKMPALENVQVQSRPWGWSGLPEEASAPVDAYGRFRIVGLSPREHHLSLRGLPQSHYVEEVRYNDRPLVDGVLPLSIEAPAAVLEIQVNDKPAVLMGTVTDADRPVREPHVVLVQWPPNVMDPYLSVQAAAGDENGRYMFPGLAPGDYRILAVASEVAGKFEETATLQRLLADAEQVTLSGRSTRLLDLKLTGP